MGTVALLAGGFYAGTSVLVTILLATWAALDPDFEYVDPLWAWAAVMAALAAATAVVAIEAARRGWRVTKHPEADGRFALALFGATLLWLAWTFAASVWFIGFAVLAVAFGACLALFWLGVERLRAVLDSRR